MRRSLVWLGIGAAVSLLALAAVVFNPPYTLRGSAIDPPIPAPAIDLPQAGAGDFRLSDQKGSIVLVFFGFTSCPDVCPTTLAEMTQIRRNLGKDAGRLKVVFITVDPDRDTPERAQKYAAGFDPTFIGLSGAEQQLAPVWQAYGVYRKLNKANAADTNYEVEHTSRVYLIDPAGNLRLTYTYGTPVEDILQDVRYLLKRG